MYRRSARRRTGLVPGACWRWVSPSCRFSLNTSTSSLLLSTSTSTLLLHLSPQVQQIDLVASIASAPTLAAAILPGSRTLVNVTATAVTLWDNVETGKSAAIWQAPGEITSAQISEDRIVVSTVGGNVHVLKASATNLECIA